MLTKADNKSRARPSYSVPPVVRAVKVLRHISAGRSVANQSQAAREIGINRTTLLRLLHTLEAEGLIERVPNSEEFVLGPGMIELAAHKLHSLDLAKTARPVLTRLAEKLGLSAHLGILEKREVVYIVRATPDVHLVSNIRIGTRLPAHASSLGRTILAQMPRADVDGLFAGFELFRVTEKTPTSLKALHTQLDEIRAAGVSDNRSAFEAGIDAISAPVFDHSGSVVGAINASGPESAFGMAKGRRAEIGRAVREAAAEISHRLGWPAARARSA